jgi:hypothetical protein
MVEDEHRVNENHFDNCHIPFLNLFLYPKKLAMDDLFSRNKILEIWDIITLTFEEYSREHDAQCETRSYNNQNYNSNILKIRAHLF